MRPILLTILLTMARPALAGDFSFLIVPPLVVGVPAGLIVGWATASYGKRLGTSLLIALVVLLFVVAPISMVVLFAFARVLPDLAMAIQLLPWHALADGIPMLPAFLIAFTLRKALPEARAAQRRLMNRQNEDLP